MPALPEDITATSVIRRMKEDLRVKTDAQLADTLGVGKTTISSWRQRNAVPFEECVRVAIWERGNLLWLLTGRGKDKMQPGLLEGPLYHHLLLVALEHFQRLDLGDLEPQRRIELQARFVTSEYNRLEAMMHQAMKEGGVSREDFVRALRRAYDTIHDGDDQGPN